jgi:hypothetical protein
MMWPMDWQLLLEVNNYPQFRHNLRELIIRVYIPLVAVSSLSTKRIPSECGTAPTMTIVSTSESRAVPTDNLHARRQYHRWVLPGTHTHDASMDFRRHVILLGDEKVALWRPGEWPRSIPCMKGNNDMAAVSQGPVVSQSVSQPVSQGPVVSETSQSGACGEWQSCQSGACWEWMSQSVRRSGGLWWLCGWSGVVWRDM